MIEHVTEWLGAYLDGELRGLRLRQVEAHLAQCAACRSELENLRGLSTLLQGTAPVGGFVSTERFVSTLTLRLPRRPEASLSRKALQAGWWLIPAGVLGAWVCLQIVSTLTALVFAVQETGLLGNLTAWLRGTPQQAEWFSAIMYLFGAQLSGSGLFTLEALNQVDLFVQNLAGQLIWQIALVVLYWGWLASWWLRHRKPASSQGTPRLPRIPS